MGILKRLWQWLTNTSDAPEITSEGIDTNYNRAIVHDIWHSKTDKSTPTWKPYANGYKRVGGPTKEQLEAYMRWRMK